MFVIPQISLVYSLVLAGAYSVTRDTLRPILCNKIYLVDYQETITYQPGTKIYYYYYCCYGCVVFNDISLCLKN